MRVTDNRYTGELDKFDLAVRMIRHEARTGTIRACTGFTEDRIRKLYGTYFRSELANDVRRRRGKSPRQIGRFVCNSHRQTEATVLGCLFLFCKVVRFNADGGVKPEQNTDRVRLGLRLCQAFETYRDLHPEPQLSLEWAWNLYHALVVSRELYFAWCDTCEGAYIQDAFALDYARCPMCELKDQEFSAPGAGD